MKPGVKGTFIAYRDIDFKPDTLATIRTANVVIEEYESKGYMLTLRQLYYQFVARGLIENSQSSYTRLGDIVSNGRLAGLIAWTAIEDRTRNLMGVEHFESPDQAFRKAIDDYRIDLWYNQAYRPEVWVEKDALIGVVGSICERLRVDFFACRGYMSQSEQWRAGRRMARYVSRGQTPIVFHLGDHDPSGIDMTRDNRERLALFAGTDIVVQRLALNWPQIEQLGPPPNPVKFQDSRAEGYVKEYGTSSWELDALPPDVVASLIDDAVRRVRDPDKWSAALDEEQTDKMQMEDTIGDPYDG